MEYDILDVHTAFFPNRVVTFKHLSGLISKTYFYFSYNFHGPQFNDAVKS